MHWQMCIRDSLLDRLEELRMLIAAKADVNSDVPFVLSTIHSSKGLEYDRVVPVSYTHLAGISGFPAARSPAGS